MSAAGIGIYCFVSITSEILELPVDERLKCMEALWGSLRNEELASPAWHGSVLSDRRAKVESGEAMFVSSAELKSRLAKD